jgi:AcrR family transcriptional regulator
VKTPSRLNVAPFGVCCHDFDGQNTKTSLREIAERVGITKASLYHHYSSKQDLLRAIVGTFFDDMREVLAAVRTTQWSPERELRGRYLDVVIRHRDSGPTMLRDLAAVLAASADSMDELIAAVREFHVWLAGPHPSVANRLRGVAASEAIGTALSSGLLAADVSDEEMHEVVLDTALAVLDRRDNVPFKHLEGRVVG